MAIVVRRRRVSSPITSMLYHSRADDYQYLVVSSNASRIRRLDNDILRSTRIRWNAIREPFLLPSLLLPSIGNSSSLLAGLHVIGRCSIDRCLWSIQTRPCWRYTNDIDQKYRYQERRPISGHAVGRSIDTDDGRGRCYGDSDISPSPGRTETGSRRDGSFNITSRGWRPRSQGAITLSQTSKQVHTSCLFMFI